MTARQPTAPATRRDPPRVRRRRELQRNLHILSAVVRRVLEQEPVASLPGAPISVDQMRFLRFVALNPGLRVRDLAAGLGVQTSSASLTLDRLEAKGFVERRADGRDRRSVRAVATPAGQALVEAAGRAIDAKLEAAIERLGTRDAARFAAQAGEFARALMQGEDYFGDICLQCGPGYSKSCVIHQMFATCRYPD